MTTRAVAANVPFAWVTGEEVYGDNRRLRVWLEQQEVHFVLVVRSNQHVWTQQMRQETAAQLAQSVTEQDWQTLSAGDGAKGPGWYEWGRVPLLSWQMPGQRWQLLRKSCADGKLAYYAGYVAPGTSLETMVRVAGCEAGDSLVAMATASLGHRPVRSLLAQGSNSMIYNCIISNKVPSRCDCSIKQILLVLEK